MLTVLLLVVGAAVAGAVGGALAGIKIGGEVMGNQVAALMGGFFGLSSVVPAALLAAVTLHLIR